MRLSNAFNRKGLTNVQERVKGSSCIRLHVHASASSSQSAIGKRSKLKDDVKRAVANTNRGKKASGQQQKDILLKVQALEAENPTSSPAESPLLSGRWSLLYTGPGKEDDVDWEKRTGGVEGPVLAALRPLSANAVRLRGITQIIDAKGGSVENLAEFRVASLFNGYLNVAGLVAVAPSDIVNGLRAEGALDELEDAVRVDVKFTSFGLKLGLLPELKVPLGWANPTGWVDTTYLDEDFRIGRGDKGSVFVTALQEKRHPADLKDSRHISSRPYNSEDRGVSKIRHGKPALEMVLAPADSNCHWKSDSCGGFCHDVASICYSP